jgi:hexosaminidase
MNMPINTIPAHPKSHRFGETFHAGRLICPAYGETAALLNKALKGPAGAELQLTISEGGQHGAYRLETAAGGIKIAGDREGIFSAFSTLASLVQYDEQGSFFPAAIVEDQPCYHYRGIMLDVARHFFGTDEVKKILDIMFRLKLNKFHWHFADDQGFRIALKKYPALEKIAAHRKYTAYGGQRRNKGNDGTPHSGFYTENEIREICAYAAARGIEVIPEIDMPGHLSALIAAYPELSCNGKPIEVPGHFGILDNVLCIGNDGAMKFMENLVLDVVRLFDAKTFHIGFDEVETVHQKTCPRCQEKIKNLNLINESGLKAYAKNRFRDFLKKNGVRVIMYNDGMEAADPGVVCFHWFSPRGLVKKTVSWINQGQKAIIGPFTHMYMDYPYSYLPLKKTYAFNPCYRGINKPKNILGVEALFWTEYVKDHGKLAFNAYYRMAALAEIGWNGNAKRPYGEFMAALRRGEEYYFGETLAIPEKVLNPGFLSRLRGRHYLLYDMNGEYYTYTRTRRT